MLQIVTTLAVLAADRSLVMTADPGYYSGVSEAKYILANMTNQVNISSAMPFCAEVVEGALAGQPVTLVTTGIGHDNAGACTVSLLAYYSGKGVAIKDAIYLGTSGWSPMVGGVFNPATDAKCENSPKNPTPSQLIGVGDVCISPASFLQGCGFCGWPDTTLGECVALPCASHNQTSVFSQCNFFAANTALADELLAASKQVSFPERPADLQSYLTKYWSDMWKGIEVDSQTMPGPVAVHDYNTCAESAGYEIWKGVPKENQCREYQATLLGDMLGTKKSPDEMVCVSAMEGPGWMRVLLNKGAQGGAIPFVGLRGASNYVMWPLQRTSTGAIMMDNDWISPQDQEDFTLKGYHFAIKTTTSIVLQHFANRAGQ